MAKPKPKPTWPSLMLQPAGETPRDRIKLKFLVFGKPGSGKTRFTSGAEHVAICLVESQGFATIHENNPHAIIPALPDEDGVPVLKTMREVRDFCILARRGVLAKAGVKTLVFDSLTQIQRMMMEEITAEKTQNRDTFSQNDYGTLGRRMQGFLNLLRDLPYRVFAICLADWYDLDDGTREMQPLLVGKVQKSVGGYFHSVLYAYNRQDDNTGEEVGYYLLASGDSKYSVKPYSTLRGVLQPDANLILRVAANPDGEETAATDGPLPGASASGERRGPRFSTDTDTDDTQE